VETSKGDQSKAITSPASIDLSLKLPGIVHATKTWYAPSGSEPLNVYLQLLIQGVQACHPGDTSEEGRKGGWVAVDQGHTAIQR
jgi:hypothetical protein